MGSTHSHSLSSRRNREWNQANNDDVKNVPDFIIFEPNDIPEEYRVVNVSADVIQRINEINVPKLNTRAELELIELEENESLHRQINDLKQLQHLHNEELYDVMKPNQEAINDRKRIYDETIKNVEKRFFNPQNTTDCIPEENLILRCITENPKQALNCTHLYNSYRNCVENFKIKVLEENQRTLRSPVNDR